MKAALFKPICDGATYQTPSLKTIVLTGTPFLQINPTSSFAAENEGFSVGEDIII